MLEKEYKQQVLFDLGAPTLDVEIDDAAWCGIFSAAIRWFRARKGLTSCAIIPIFSGQTEYDFPENAATILDVKLPTGSDVQSLLSLGFFDAIPANMVNVYQFSNSYNSYSSWVQILQTLKERRRVFSAEPVWDILCNKIIVSNANQCAGNGSGYMLVIYKKDKFTIDELKDRDEEMMYRYVLALSKRMLGRIRSKYKSYPAAGGTIDTDGPELLEEGKEEMLALNDEIAESQYPMGLLLS